MPKRQKLNFDNQQLTQNLKASKGRGMDALFPPVSSPEEAETIEKTMPAEGRRKQTKPGIDRKLTENGGQTRGLILPRFGLQFPMQNKCRI